MLLLLLLLLLMLLRRENAHQQTSATLMDSRFIRRRNMRKVAREVGGEWGERPRSSMLLLLLLCRENAQQTAATIFWAVGLSVDAVGRENVQQQRLQ